MILDHVTIIVHIMELKLYYDDVTQVGTKK